MKQPLTGAVALVFLAAVFAASPASAQLSAKLGDRVTNWTRPMQLTTEADKTPPRLFIGVDPCRIVDTRGAAGPYGAPSLAGGVPRNFALQAGPCAGLPTTIDAYSLNITVVNTLGPGFILIYPQGGAAPVVSTLNYVTGQVVANAAIVPAGTGAGVTVVAGVSGTDLIIDINGYFSSVLGTPNNFFRLDTNSFGYTMFLRNLSTTCGGICGIYQEVNGTGGTTAIFGVSNGTGAGVGVQGQSNGTASGAAGVYGVDASTALPLGTSNLKAGVYGVSKNGLGVEGISETSAGVRGESYTSAGVFRALGLLGFGDYGVYSNGNMFASGTISGTIKAFVQPHPTDATKEIDYISLEGPASEVYFRGSTNVARGLTTIPIPDHFRLVSRSGSYSAIVSPVGAMANVAVIEQGENGIVVQASRDVKINYVVYAERETFKGHVPVTENIHFVPESENGLLAVAPAYKQILIENGTLNPDGTTNLQTADRLGWRRAWEEKKAKDAADVAAAAAVQAKAAAPR